MRKYNSHFLLCNQFPADKIHSAKTRSVAELTHKTLLYAVHIFLHFFDLRREGMILVKVMKELDVIFFISVPSRF